MFKRIPNQKMIEPYGISNYIDEELVELTEDYGFIIDMQYPKMNFINSINKCLVRKEVLDRLLIAKRYLPKGITFKIWDGYRPMILQQDIYDRYSKDIIKQLHLEKLEKEKQDYVIAQYVSIPINTKELYPLHTTGGSIDLTLIDENTKEEIDLGVKFDEFSCLSKSNAYEQKGMDKHIRQNRRILYNAMIKAGFTNLPSEIWHYDYGNRAWAFYGKKEAIYNSIET